MREKSDKNGGIQQIKPQMYLFISHCLLLKFLCCLNEKDSFSAFSQQGANTYLFPKGGFRTFNVPATKKGIKAEVLPTIDN